MCIYMHTHGSKPEVSEILAYITIDDSIPPGPLHFCVLLSLSSTSYFPKGSMILRDI